MTTMASIDYKRPSHLQSEFYKIVNPVLRFMVMRFGYDSRKEQDALFILRVRGRKSGKLYDMPVRIAVFNGERYIVSMLGESQWVRNLRAVGTGELITGQNVEAIKAHEISGEEKTALLRWYCQLYASRVRYGFGVDPKRLTSVELDRLARLYPVFRLEPAQL
jgi:deazaflavin-dependent oxidoreductase (nitroreductase family)